MDGNMVRDSIVGGNGDHASSGETAVDRHQGQKEVGNVGDNDAGQGGEGPSEKVDPGMISNPTSDELMKELETLKVVVEHQKQLLEKGEEERRKLSKKYARAKLVFKDLWDLRIPERKRLERELFSLKEQQEELLNTVVALKGTLAQACGQTGTKLEEIRKLTKKVEELGHDKINPMNSEPGMGKLITDIVFPEEVWRIIIANVSDPKDLWNLCNTDPLFDRILFKWKTGWLLGQALPYLYQHLPGDKLLKCRTICKSWKDNLDNFLENHPSLQAHDAENSDPRRLDYINPMKEKQLGLRFRINFYSGIDLSIFEDPSYVAKWKRTRFIGRTITLKLGRDRMDSGEDDYYNKIIRWNENSELQCRQMWSAFCGFLSSFGKEVQSLTFACFWNVPGYGDVDDDFEDVWESNIFPFLSVDLFQLFPNLRRLHICYRRIGCDEDFPEVKPESIPKMAKLETFGSDCWGESVATAVLRRHHLQLRKLHITVGTWREVKNFNWPKLTELKSDKSLMHMIYNDHDLPFQRQGMSLPQLRKLNLQIDNYFLGSPVVLQNVIHALSIPSYSQLNTLRLYGEFNGTFFGKIDGISYALSQISTLELEHARWRHNPPNFDFLLHCFPLLKNLNVFVQNRNTWNDHLPNTEVSLDLEYGKSSWWSEYRRVHHGNKVEQIVEVSRYLYDGEMYKSKIWELLPLLNVFTFQWDIYTREGYQAYRCKLNKDN